MKTIYLLPFALLLLSQQLFGQEKPRPGTIKGIVYDKETQQTLPGVNIVVQGTDQKGSFTDEKGAFLITGLAAGNYTLVFSFIGYSKKKIDDLKLAEEETLNFDKIELEEQIFSLSQVTVTPGSFSVMGNIPLSKQTLAEKDIKNMSFSEDVTRTVSRLPGVSSNEFSSKFTVRGGEDDEILITIDGMELYDPFHQRDFAGGLFSIVDIETIQGIELLTGGFAADFGNRQSGVFNMKTKHIPEDQQTTSLGLSFFNARFYTDGRFAKNKGSYLFSARRSMLDLSFKLVGQKERNPNFYDALAKLEYKLSDKHFLSLHALQAGDKTAIRDISPEAFDIHDTKYGNTYGWLTLKSFYHSKLYSRTLLFSGYLTHDRIGSMNKNEYTDKVVFNVNDQREFSFVGIKQDWNWDVSDHLTLKTGFDLRQLNTSYDYDFAISDLRITPADTLRVYTNSFAWKSKPKGQQASAFISGKFSLSPNLFMETGLRYDYASYARDYLWSPRLSLAYAFSENTFLRGAWGYYYQTQFIQTLDVNHNITTFDPAQLSKHYVLGFDHLFKNGLNMRLEAYVKDISRMSPDYSNLRDLWELFPESRNDEVRLTYNGATAMGIELFLKYDTGKKISWWFSYALAKAEEEIASIEFDGILGERTGVLPRPNNQNHTVFIDVNYRPNPKWVLNLAWQYYVGWPLTTYGYGFKTLDNGDLHFYQTHNGFRAEQTPAYHRMDLRINRHFSNLKKGRISAYLHLINLYNRQNLRKWDLDILGDDELLSPDGKGGYNTFESSTTWFGLTPILGASWEF